jgi:anti-sigma factor RsiW
MNCQLCQKEMDAYRDGELPCDIMTQVESHLEACETCSGIYRMQVLADKIIDQEKKLQSDPFLATRVMAKIDALGDSGFRPATALMKVLKPVLVTSSMAAAIFFGITLGNLLRPVNDREKIPVELALIDDASIESVSILLNE